MTNIPTGAIYFTKPIEFKAISLISGFYNKSNILTFVTLFKRISSGELYFLPFCAISIIEDVA